MQRTKLIGAFGGIVCLGALGTYAAAVAQPGVDARGSTPSLDVAEYTAEGRLEFPAGTDRWIAVGSGIGSDYAEEAFDPARPGAIGVVQMEPAAYDYFLEHRRYADGTMLLLTFYAVQEKPDPALRGFVQGDIAEREIHVIDRERFPDEGRAFFVYSPSADEPAAPLPRGSECVVCHTEHGDLDATFTQFYPALRGAGAAQRD